MKGIPVSCVVRLPSRVARLAVGLVVAASLLAAVTPSAAQAQGRASASQAPIPAASTIRVPTAGQNPVGPGAAGPRGMVPRLGSSQAPAIQAGRLSTNPSCPKCNPPLVFRQGQAVIGGISGTPGAVTITPVYWAPSNYSFPASYKSVVNVYIGNVAAASTTNTNVFSVATQYYQQSLTPGAPKQYISYSVVAGTEVDDSSVFPGGAGGCTADAGFSACVSDAQLQTELQSLLAARSLPVDDSHLYMVMFPGTVETCFGAGVASATNPCSTNVYCAYHSSNNTPPWLIYANEPYPDLVHCSGGQAPNGDSEADAQVSLISHEASEAITDWAGAWIDSAMFENGDQCAYVYGAPLGGSTSIFYNQVIGSGHYYTQDEFSNEDYALGLGDHQNSGGPLVAGCVQREELPIAQFTPPNPLPAGSSASFDGSPSHDPDNVSGIVSYAWSWGDGTAGGTGMVAPHTFAAIGTYIVGLTVTDVGGWTGTTTVAVTAGSPVCSSAGISPDKASPQPVQTVVTFTGSSSGCTSPEYLFYLQPPGGNWAILRGYGGPTFMWNTTGLVPGVYNIDVWARQVGSSAPWEAVLVVSFDLAPIPPCAGAAIAPDKASPQAAGTLVTFTATSTTCPNPEYLFYEQPPGGYWALVRGYGGATFAWDTTGLAPGSYSIDVWVRQIGSGVAEQSFQLITYMIASPPACAGAAVTPDKASSQQTGTIVTFTATSTACTSPEYLFYEQPVGGFWNVVRGYGGPTFVWNTTGLGPGTYNIDVWVRQVGSGVAEQSFQLIGFTLVAAVPCTTAGIGSDKPSGQQAGTIVTFTGTSAACSQPAYLYYVKPSGGAWSLARGYGAAAFAWNTAGLAPGTYTVDVWVRQNGSAAAQEAFTLVGYTLAAPVPCATAGLGPDLASPRPAGTTVTFTATSSACSQPQYLFYVKTPAGVWSLAQGYGSSAFVWQTGGLPAGTYSVDAWVRQNGSSAPYESFLLVTYTLS